MRSIKPGRGPSMMGGFMGIFAILFGIFWTIMAPSFMKIFGVCFVGMAIGQTIYNFKNATSKNRYSAFDIVDSSEEVDPLNERFGAKRSDDDYIQMRESDADDAYAEQLNEEMEFCPYCGVKVLKDFEYCHKCGKKLP